VVRIFIDSVKAIIESTHGVADAVSMSAALLRVANVYVNMAPQVVPPSHSKKEGAMIHNFFPQTM
jgi:hypothetical protein